MLSKKTKFLAAVAAQMCVIFGIIVFKVSVISGGVPVLLPIEPVDPRDLLRGDYITFQYKISDLEPSYFAYSPVNNGDTVYVPLKEGSGVWSADKGVVRKIPKGDRRVFLRGKVESDSAGTFSGPASAGRNTKTVRVRYGIEEYFIPEGEGGNVSMWKREDKACAGVKVDSRGRAVITEIIVNGKPWP